MTINWSEIVRIVVWLAPLCVHPPLPSCTPLLSVIKGVIEKKCGRIYEADLIVGKHEMITAFHDRLKRSIIVTARFTSTRSSLQVLMAIDILQRQDSTPRERHTEREKGSSYD